jgi:hypothetical protein
MAHPAPTIANNLMLVSQKLVSSEFSHECLITLAFDITGFSTRQDQIDDFQTSFNARFASLLSNTTTIEPPTALIGDGSNVPFFVVAAGAAGTGGRNISTPPPNTAALLRKSTAKAGKKNRGRTYLPLCLSEDDVNNAGVLTSGVVANLSAAAALVLSDGAADGNNMVIANKTLVTTPPETRPHVTAITMGEAVTSWVCETLAATQRRRMRS